MEQGELKRRRRAKALKALSGIRSKPHLTTTESLCALDAGCGPVKFHRILYARGLATPIKGFDGGYDFHLPEEYGGGTYSIEHHSFQWSPAGIAYMARILNEEGISYTIPEELRRWL